MLSVRVLSDPLTNDFASGEEVAGLCAHSAEAAKILILQS
jgi:hypothetical protein